MNRRTTDESQSMDDGRATGRRALAVAVPLLLVLGALGVAPAAADPSLGTDTLASQLHRNLDLAGALMETDDPIAAAKLATAWQAASVGVTLESVAAPRHGTPSEAVWALVGRHHVSPTDEQVAQVMALDALPAVQQDALVGVVDAFLAVEDATRIAYQDAEFGTLVELAGVDSDEATGGTMNLLDAGVQVGLILGTRNDFLDAVVAFWEVFEGFPMTAAGLEVDLCPAIALDFAGGDTTYNSNCALIIDNGGYDSYLNNAGGSRLVGAPDDCSLGNAAWGSAALVDFSGDDHYVSGGRCGYNGGGTFGTGFLFDQSGNDEYTVGGTATNGGGAGGVGFLLDGSGDDTYIAGRAATNGGGSSLFGGIGFLLDNDGNDTYDAGPDGTNGGGALGMGFLLDQGGDDIYSAGWRGTNGGGDIGVGFLLDKKGNDLYYIYYPFDTISINGGGNLGTGLLFDASGIDGYQVYQDPLVVDQTVVPKGMAGAQVDKQVPPQVPEGTLVKLKEESDGSIIVYLDFDNDDEVDPGEEIVSISGSPPPSVNQERTLADENNVPVAPRVPLPPITTPGQEVPDHEGTEPVPVVDLGSVVTYDSGSDLCVDFVPKGGSAQNLACVATALLGPAGGLVPRQEMPIAVGLPGTGPQPTPDVEEVPGGSLGSTPGVTRDLYAGYHYDEARLFRAASLLGDDVEAWGPFAPGDEEWFLASGDVVDFFVTVTVYQDGNVVETETVSVPFLGQALAAAEKAAGTL